MPGHNGHNIKLDLIEQGLVASWYEVEVSKQGGELLHASVTNIFRPDDKNYEGYYTIDNKNVEGEIPGALLFCLTHH
jgi:hypothetical protein